MCLCQQREIDMYAGRDKIERRNISLFHTRIETRVFPYSII